MLWETLQGILTVSSFYCILSLNKERIGWQLLKLVVDDVAGSSSAVSRSLVSDLLSFSGNHSVVTDCTCWTRVWIYSLRCFLDLGYHVLMDEPGTLHRIISDLKMGCQLVRQGYYSTLRNSMETYCYYMIIHLPQGPCVTGNSPLSSNSWYKLFALSRRFSMLYAYGL